MALGDPPRSMGLKLAGLPSNAWPCRLTCDDSKGETKMNGEVAAAPNELLVFFIQLLPLVLVTIPPGIVAYLLSKQKGRDSLATTIIAFVPFVSLFVMFYFVGATNRLTESKLD